MIYIECDMCGTRDGTLLPMSLGNQVFAHICGKCTNGAAQLVAGVFKAHRAVTTTGAEVKHSSPKEIETTGTEVKDGEVLGD